MKIGNIVGHYAVQLCRTFCAAAVVAMLVASFVHAAQRDNQTENLQKEIKEPGVKAEPRGTLTVEVMMIESVNGKEGRPVAGATVHILGGEEPRDTNEKGRVRFSKVPTGPLSFDVIITKVATCKISGVTVSEGDQVVAVQVDKSQEGKCTRLK